MNRPKKRFLRFIVGVIRPDGVFIGHSLVFMGRDLVLCLFHLVLMGLYVAVI